MLETQVLICWLASFLPLIVRRAALSAWTTKRLAIEVGAGRILSADAT
jgi:hypothetical protein